MLLCIEKLCSIQNQQLNKLLFQIYRFNDSRGGPPRPMHRGRPGPGPYQNNYPPNQNAPPPAPQTTQSSVAKDQESPKAVTTTTAPAVAKTANSNSGPPTANSNSNSNNQSSGPINRTGLPRRGAPRGRSGYNPNINVTGGEQPPSPQHKPFYRGSSRGRGGYQNNGPPRPPPPPHQTGNGNIPPPSNQFPVKRGPPVGPPGPKRGKIFAL